MLKSKLFFFFFLLLFCSNAQIYENPHDYFEGMGRQDDPFLIQNLEDLNNLRLFANSEWDDMFYEQTNDIDLDVAPYNSGLGWEPIGRPVEGDYVDQGFQANYNGNGYQIKGLYINRPNEDYVGLFGYTTRSAKIRNVRIVNGYVTGRDHAGGVLGYNSNESTIEDSYFDGFVKGSEYVGGLVGRNTGAYVLTSFSLGLVQGERSVGGLVGFNSFTSGSQGVLASYSNASVIGDSYVGGLIGHSNNGYIANSYSVGMIICDTWCGGLVGLNEGSISQNAWNKETAGLDWIDPVGAGSPKTTEEMLDADVMSPILVHGMVLPNGEAYGYLAWQGEPWPHNYPGKYNLTLESNPDNSAVFTGEGEYDGGTIAFIKAVPKPGYEFSNWMGADHQLANKTDSFAYPMPYEDITLTAYFTPLDYNLSVEVYPEEAGEISISPEKNHYHVGDQITLTATSHGDLLFANWTDEDGNALSEDAGFVYTMPAKNATVIANFGVHTLQVNVVDETKGGVEIFPHKPFYNPGEEITITSIPAEGCFIGQWNDNHENELGVSGVLTYIMPESDAVITATFERYFDVGFGSEENPWLIETAEQLENVGRFTGKEHVDKHFSQVSDIDLGVIPWNEGAGWKPIGGPLYADAFSGAFDGNDHSIINLYINRPDENIIGLFGMLAYCEIKNVHLKDVDVTGNNSVGGLVGSNRSVNSHLFIENSSVTGMVQGNGRVGGLVGESLHLSVISDCMADVMVSGEAWMGGFVGYASNFTRISRSASYGDVIGSSSNLGGFVGTALDRTIIEDCYSKGSVTGNSYCGGFAGHLSAGLGRLVQIINCYSTGDVSGESWLGGFAGNLEGNVALTNSFYNIDKVKINDENQVTRGGIYNDQFEDWMDNEKVLDITRFSESLVPVGEYYEIATVQGMKDLLGFSGDENLKFRLSDNIDLSELPGYNISYSNLSEFDGDGHTLSGIHVTQSSFYSPLGLFATAHKTAIRNLRIIDVYMSGSNSVGGLVGTNIESVIENCAVEDGHISGNVSIGGLVGHSRQGEIYNSYAIANVIGQQHIGGLLGENNNNSVIANCYAICNVLAAQAAGGLVGAGRNITLENSYAVTLSANGSTLGGIVASLLSNTDNVYNNYWDAEISGIGTCDAQGEGSEGKTTAEMLTQSTFENWDFDQVWSIVEGETYPYLSWQSAPSAYHYPPGVYQLDLLASPEEGGSVSGDGEYPAGALVRLLADPVFYYEFAGWRDEDDVIISEDSEFLFQMPSSDVVLTAEFVLKENMLTVDVSPQGTGGVNVDPEKDYYHYNDLIVLTAVAADGYRFASWTNMYGQNLGSNESYQFYMPAVDYSVTALFELAEYTFQADVTPSNTGTVTIDPEKPLYNMGDQITLNATPEADYVFVGWKDAEDNVIGSDQELNYTMPPGNTIVYAEFALKGYELTVNSVPYNAGAIVVSPEKVNYQEGDMLNLSVTPEAGYSLMNWTDDEGNVLGNDEVLQFTMPARDIQIFANFSIVNNLVDFALDGIHAYPNPVDDLLVVDSECFMAEVRLIALSGETVLIKQDVGSRAEVNVGDFSPGLYLLKVVTAENVKVFTIVVNP
ncbi:InlB B-repeat-containing protein [Alkalitalea saponilacus]|uniref:Por secretion system C-terminal sorting domain-containing protein n=1 Tax=Alkalitalea saponilacus TaxID=889453 RepID=A0A1T5C9H5_9BACT|nr:GLUG motif-containing protein [Alkalitalea saponilacus]ASB49769.1 hypothetical protein CDL62_11790 [Alkalitalea saponilacus]SKB55760.1 Por secretion system C-terminal sorting domain-containing protein [Alkalitalea saponilacus]